MQDRDQNIIKSGIFVSGDIYWNAGKGQNVTKSGIFVSGDIYWNAGYYQKWDFCIWGYLLECRTGTRILWKVGFLYLGIITGMQDRDQNITKSGIFVSGDNYWNAGQGPEYYQKWDFCI